MSNNSDDNYEVGYGKPPKPNQFGAKNGNKPNRKGRKKSAKNSMQSELESVFGSVKELTVGGKEVKMSVRQIIFQQIAKGAAKGDPAMIRIALPLIKGMDDAPEFEMLPEDEEVLKQFRKNFNTDGGEQNE